MVTYFTDTDTDFTPVDAEKYGFKLISMPYCIEDKTIYPYIDFETFDMKGFYDSLRNGVTPSTCGLSKETYIDYFEPEFKKGNDVFYVHFSAAMSSTFDFMHLAVNELKEKYPERKFYELDTKGISINSLGIIYEIGDMVLAGKTPEEILKWSETEVDKFATYFFANDLSFFKRTGRVSGLGAVFGTLLGIKPIIYMNSEGKMVSIGKEKGKIKAMNKLLQYMEDLGDDIKNHRVLVAHADCADDMEIFIKKAKEKFGDDLNITLVPVNPTAGSHCGPSSAGVCFHAIHR